MLALVLALQEPPTTPLPPQMEPAMDSYVRCLSAQTDRQRMGKPTAGPTIFEAARRACREVRTKAIATSDTALASLPAFADPRWRGAFIAERFDGLDQMMAETFAGGMDPDKWKD